MTLRNKLIFKKIDKEQTENDVFIEESNLDHIWNNIKKTNKLHITKTISTLLFRTGSRSQDISKILQYIMKEEKENIIDYFVLCLILYAEKNKNPTVDQLFLATSNLSNVESSIKFQNLLEDFSKNEIVIANNISLEALNRYGVIRLIQSMIKLTKGNI